MSSSSRDLVFALTLICFLLPRGALWAQAGRGAERTGYELALHGNSQAIVGRSIRLTGVVYEVRGLAALRALARGHVRARYETDAADVRSAPWTEVVAGEDGRFQIEVPIPENAHGRSRILFSAGERARDEARREIEVPISLNAPHVLEIRTDRALYEPGETVHVWALLRDTSSLAPVSNQPVRFAVTGENGEVVNRVTTTRAGVASYSFALSEVASSGVWTVRAQVERGAVRAQAENHFTIGRRRIQRLFADLEVLPEVAAPREEITVRVEARSQSGAPVRGAHVELEMELDQHFEGETDDRGIAEITIRAPAFLSDPSGRVIIDGTLSHPGYGAREIGGEFTLSLPLTLQVDVLPLHGGLVPEVDDQLILTVLDTAGEPPAEGTEVEVRGLAVEGGTHRARTDRHGLAVVPMHVPREAATTYIGSGRPNCSGGAATSVDVVILGSRPRAAHLCVPVSLEAHVAPRVSEPVVQMGEQLEVGLARSPTVAGHDIGLEVLQHMGDREHLVASLIVPPGESTVRVDLPEGRVGLFWVRARPLDMETSSRGAGAIDAFIVRPRNLSFPVIESDSEVYNVLGTANVTVRTNPAAAPSFMAVLVRDLAVHEGERPFEYRFLSEALDRALLDPAEESSTLLIRAALAVTLPADTPPVISRALTDELGVHDEEGYAPAKAAIRGDLRDPIARSYELRSRGIGQLMVAVEGAVERELGHGRIERLITGTGKARRFRPNVVATISDSDSLPLTLGGEPLSIAHVAEVDPSFTYEAVARRVARRHLVELIAQVTRAFSIRGPSTRPRRGADPMQRIFGNEPPDRWLSILVQRGVLRAEELNDPWGGAFAIRSTTRDPVIRLGVDAEGWELSSPGPDGISGNADDMRDPFERIVEAGTPYAVASGEDELMQRLATISPARTTLMSMLAAYQLLGREAAEEETGDVASAGVSEDVAGQDYTRFEGTIGLGNLNTIGHGGGGGSGSGYGRGGGGMGLRRAQMPTVRAGPAAIHQGGGRGVLSALMRERFPATLQFLTESPVDPSGVTGFEIPLAHAVTTYRVEVVVWSVDGWSWSASHDLRVDQEVVVDSPVPPVSTVGDRICLPLYSANRQDQPLRIRLRLSSSELGIREDADVLEVAASRAGAAPVDIALDRAGEGVVTIEGRSESGDVLDAMQRPMRVVEDHRRVRLRESAIIEGNGSLELEVPSDASPLGNSEVQVSLGLALFERQREELPLWEAWSQGLAGRPVASELLDAVLEELPEDGGVSDGLRTALALGAIWNEDAADDERLEAVLVDLTDQLGVQEQSSRREEREYHQVWQDCAILLAMAPLTRNAAARPELEQTVHDLATALRRRVEEGAVRITEAPWLWAHAAAALFWTAADDTTNRRAEELLRRSRRSLIDVGDELWLEGGALDGGENLRAGSAFMALAELSGGERARALSLVLTLGRRAISRNASFLTSDEELDSWGPALAAVEALFTGPRASEVVVVIDGRERRLDLEGGAASAPAPELEQPGHHRVELRGTAGAVALLTARSEYGIPWQGVTQPQGSIVMSIAGEAGARDDVAELEIEVRNRSPRRLPTPVLEVYLPAGAELGPAAREALENATVSPPLLDDRILTLTLPPLPAGGTTTVDLALRWTVAGRLRGLGIVGYAADRPGRVSVLPSREIHVRDREEGGVR